MNFEHEFEAIFQPKDVARIIFWLKKSGEIALREFGETAFDVKQDATFVTKADKEIEKFLLNKIRFYYPKHRVISEETNFLQLQFGQGDITWTIDPIDGTTAFIQGLTGWGISIGILRQGKPHMGFYYMPLTNDLTYVDCHGNVVCSGRKLTAKSLKRSWESKGFLALTTSAHTQFDLRVKHARALGSNMTNLVYTARGSAVATLIPKAYMWDVAAGAAILDRLGGELRYLDVEPIYYKSLLNRKLVPKPIIGGHPEILDFLHEKIIPLG